VVRSIGNGVELQLVPVPSAGMRRAAARAVEDPFFPGSLGDRNQIRAILIGTEPDHISGAALRTLNAMANAR
jgi:hypothetical protein